LGERTLAALRSLSPAGPARSVLVPVYDKSQHGGRGDRVPEGQWRRVDAPLDLVFVEGWMLGFSPVDDGALAGDPDLAEPNRALAAYDRWHRLLDAFVVLRAADPSFVVEWRVEAEASMIARGRPGLDRTAIEDYVRRFLPAYARYGGAPPGIPSERQLEIWLDAGRGPISPPVGLGLGAAG